MNSIRKKLLVNGVTPPSFNNTTQALDNMDITNHKSVGVTVKVSGANAAGTVKLQWSIDGITWEDVPAVLGAVTATWTTAATKHLYANNLPLCLIRCFATSTDANPWVITGNMIGKEY